MGLHLPEAPPPESDEGEDEAEAAAAQRSRASIPMDAGEASWRLCPARSLLTLCTRRARGAGEEDHGGCGVAPCQRAVVGQGDLGRPVGGRGPEGPAEPAERRCPETRPQGQRGRRRTPTRVLTRRLMCTCPLRCALLREEQWDPHSQSSTVS